MKKYSEIFVVFAITSVIALSVKADSNNDAVWGSFTSQWPEGDCAAHRESGGAYERVTIFGFPAERTRAYQRRTGLFKMEYEMMRPESFFDVKGAMEGAGYKIYGGYKDCVFFFIGETSAAANSRAAIVMIDARTNEVMKIVISDWAREVQADGEEFRCRTKDSP